MEQHQPVADIKDFCPLGNAGITHWRPLDVFVSTFELYERIVRNVEYEFVSLRTHLLKPVKNSGEACEMRILDDCGAFPLRHDPKQARKCATARRTFIHTHVLLKDPPFNGICHSGRYPRWIAKQAVGQMKSFFICINKS